MDSDANPARVTALQERLRIVFDRVKHENELINHRLAWLWALQGLLFASFGVGLKEGHPIPKVPLIVVCSVGFISSFSVGVVSWMSHEVLDPFNMALDELFKETAHLLSEQYGSAIRYGGEWPPRGHLRWAYPWRLLPWILSVAWLVLLSWLLIVGYP